MIYANPGWDLNAGSMADDAVILLVTPHEVCWFYPVRFPGLTQ